MLPHTCYLQALTGLFDTQTINGLAHITGGGIEGNLNRILPPDLDALIHLDRIRVPQIFDVIRDHARLYDEEMLRTFNVGVGLAIVRVMSIST